MIHQLDLRSRFPKILINLFQPLLQSHANILLHIIANLLLQKMSELVENLLKFQTKE